MKNPYIEVRTNNLVLIHNITFTDIKAKSKLYKKNANEDLKNSIRGLVWAIKNIRNELKIRKVI